MSQPPKYTRVALVPGRAENSVYFYSGFNNQETIKLARNLVRICSTYFCWVFLVGCINFFAALRSGSEDDRFQAGWDFTWSLFAAWLLVYLGIQGIKTRNAPMCCCGYLNWFLGWMYLIGLFEFLVFFIGIWILAKQPNLPYGCDDWKGTHLVNQTVNQTSVVNASISVGVDGALPNPLNSSDVIPFQYPQFRQSFQFKKLTIKNTTVSVPNTKGENDVDCIKDTPYAIFLMLMSFVKLMIVATATCRARAFIRHIADISECDDVNENDAAIIQMPPTYVAVASSSTSSNAPLLTEKAPAYSNI